MLTSGFRYTSRREFVCSNLQAAEIMDRLLEQDRIELLPEPDGVSATLRWRA
jgi:hypothetical protein